MRVERALVGILCVTMAAAGGCGGHLAYNLPPAARLMEPGPGVGGPGPGVIPPAGNPYGIYGGAVNRYPAGMAGAPGGAGMGGGFGGGPMGECATAPPRSSAPQRGTHNGVMQASYESGCEDVACSCGPMNGDSPEVVQTGFHGHGGPLHGLLGHHGFMRPGSTEAYADGAGSSAATSQVAFLGDEGVTVSWDVGGYGMFDSGPLVIPGRQDFYQGAIYRLRITNVPSRPDVELFPTLEIAPVTPRTDAYLAHSPIPVQFTQEDFDQVTSGNFVTKVVYLPDPEFQELALAGVETLVSTRLDPGEDPIVEADRRGSILAILRMGNKDLRRAGVGMENGGMGYDGMGYDGYEGSEYGGGYGGACEGMEYDGVPNEGMPYDEGVPYESAPQEGEVVEEVVPASHSTNSKPKSYESQAIYNEEIRPNGKPSKSGVVPAQYCGPHGGGGYGYGYGDGGYGDGAMAGMPRGMSTASFAPPSVPPNMIAGGPQWGMPITGTPIGLPGPPHIPLGVPAGLQQHVMKNKTRVLLPPPVAKMHMSEKQRPGLNYPRPVNHVHMNETQREPLRLMPGWLSGLFSGHGAHGGGHGQQCQ
jgi:hypothetical protein